MLSLANAGRRFESLMFTDDGFPFKGSVEQMTEGRVPSYDFSEGRQLLRVFPLVGTALPPGTIIRDTAHRRWLLAEYDTTFSQDTLEYTSYRMLRINTHAHWQREGATLDTLTGEDRGSGMTDLGNIWCLMERTNREFQDNTLRAKEETKQVFTAAALQLGDQLGKMVVKRVDRIWGITLAEIQ